MSPVAAALTGRSERERAVAGLLAGTACGVCLLASTAVALTDVDYAASGMRRFQTDQAVAVACSLQSRGLQPAPGPGSAPLDPDFETYYHSVLTKQVRAGAIRPWQPWRLVRDRPLLRVHGRCAVPAHDDPGRAWLLAQGFGLIGGVAPFLILWLGPLAMALALGFMVWECVLAARGLAGVVFALLLAASPYVIESLTLPRSAVGFHLVALVLLAALAVPALRPHAPGLLAWLVRAAVAGAGFALCVLCRRGVSSMLPVFLLAVVLGGWRAAGPTQRARRAAALLAGVALFLAPWLLFRPSQRHEMWAGVWEGLGDYDTTKGHVWSDQAAAQRAWTALGRTRPLPRRVRDDLVAWLSRPEVAAALRRDVFEHVRDDPRWYAGILARRAFATVTLRRLWPRQSRDGRSVEAFEAPTRRRSALDKYWSYTASADWLGVGSRRVELPVGVLLAPPALWASWRWRRRPAPGSVDDAPLLLLGLLLAAALALPVGVSTASGTEAQATALVFYLGGAYALDDLRRWRHRHAPPAAPPERPSG